MIAIVRCGAADYLTKAVVPSVNPVTAIERTSGVAIV
jgi:hypothetical protein